MNNDALKNQGTLMSEDLFCLVSHWFYFLSRSGVSRANMKVDTKGGDHWYCLIDFNFLKSNCDTFLPFYYIHNANKDTLHELKQIFFGHFKPLVKHKFQKRLKI